MIGFVGAGNMARALAHGWHAAGIADRMIFVDAGSGRAHTLAHEVGGEVASDNTELAEQAEIILLCHKPKQIHAVASDLRSAPGELAPILSVLGGVSLADLTAAYPGTTVIRAMPNTGVEAREGVTCFCTEKHVDGADRSRIVDLLQKVGLVQELPESLMATATAIAGIAPAEFAMIVEAKVDAAVKHGMSAELAINLVTQTLKGVAGLLELNGGNTLALRRAVTSPGGITAQALADLESHAIRSAIISAVDKAVE